MAVSSGTIRAFNPQPEPPREMMPGPLHGGMGDDFLSGDQGADQLHGGAGRDTLEYIRWG